jgi:amino acid adenylation domain-containing protein
VTELLQEWVTRHAERRPDAVATVLGADRLTYGELERRACQLARVLRDSGCKQGDRVCLLVPKSPAAIVGLLAIYKADCIYVPLDPSSPARRLAKITESCESRCLLAAGPVGKVLDEMCEEQPGPAAMAMGWIGRGPVPGHHWKAAFSLTDVEGYSDAPVDSRNTRHDPAHILFTSGSTGMPKGVVITHANVIQFVEWAVRYFAMSAEDRTSGHSPLHFDLSIFDIFGTFAVGGELHLVPPELNVLPNKLADFIRASELTQWFSVPSALTYMAKFDVVGVDDFPFLRRLLWCGDVLPTSVLMYWMKRLPRVQFTNLYGPTEATIASSYYSVPRCPDGERAEIPIGRACGGEELLVLDEALGAVPPGQSGDLYIAGAGLSPGYWRDPERTRGAFLPDPRRRDPADRIYKTGDLARVGQDGLVYFLGRADSQIKSRGYRIELQEVETATNALECLQESVVVAIPTDGFEGTLIGCAYVPLPGREVTAATLRRELAKSLPPYMLPARWLALERLPKNANGKVDRRRVQEDLQRPASVAHPVSGAGGTLAGSDPAPASPRPPTTPALSGGPRSGWEDGTPAC